MKYIFGMIFVLLVGVPGVMQAYEVIDSSATKLNETTYLYAIEYQLGFEKYDMLAPIGVVRGDDSESPYLTYNIENIDEENLTEGKASALVLSTAQVKNAQYFVPAGESRRFVLFGVVKVADAGLLDNSLLRVTKLPFILRTGDTVLNNGLSKGELSPYVTNKVK
jgi:hypothetical protein